MKVKVRCRPYREIYYQDLVVEIPSDLKDEEFINDHIHNQVILTHGRWTYYYFNLKSRNGYIKN